MFEAIRRHMHPSPATAIAVIALVFAMVGGAFAANNGHQGATASAKAKRGPKGPKGATGPQGPAGAAGAAGPEGPAGAKGDAGATGATGAAGTNGKTGFTETLPKGKTETGTWAYGKTSGGYTYVPISFAIPLEAGLNEEHVHYVPNAGPTPATCEGHTAAAGNLCVFEASSTYSDGAEFFQFANPFGVGGEVGPRGGLMVFFTTAESATGAGDWAVTAP